MFAVIRRPPGRAVRDLLLLLMMTSAMVARGEEEADELYKRGQYDEAIVLASAEVERGVWNEKWPKLLIQCQLVRGKYSDALAVYQEAINRYSQSLSLRLLGREVLLANNLIAEAEREADQIFTILQRSASRFASADSLVAAGRYFVLRDEDARQVLTLFYDRVRQADPTHLDAHLATAELAISKGDFQVASQTLAIAEKLDKSDPRVGYLQSLAWASSDSAKAGSAIEQSLSLNPHFAPSLLLAADRAIDAEQFDKAKDLIRQALKINVNDWTAWAYLAVIAHLDGKYEIESLMRAAALSNWSANPGVDHLIGRKLSDHYRFAVGAQYQRQAIELDSSFTAATYQLSQDLLRLGDDKIGWELASRVSQADPYNVVAHNLMTLSDRLKTFTSIQANGVDVRMDAREAEIYGDRVLDLLLEAKRTLCEKYQVAPHAPIIVEIYPEQKDFAIRTFGLPGGAGFLGVCFGRVITANSPASQGNTPSNWQSVLWHEFCHAVTLEKTKNRMPRWLSEGISVYEEQLRDPSWGQSMTPTYREMLLDEDLTPVSQLSSSFLNPASPLHLQFAYYHSSLVVQFLVDKYGADALNQLLDELGNGLSINDAIGITMRPIEMIDDQFLAYARQQASDYGRDANWAREPSDEADQANNVWSLLKESAELIKAKDWDAARQSLEKIESFGIQHSERGGAMEMLAKVYHEQGDEERERKTLQRLNQQSSDSLATLTRLIQFAIDDGQWEDALDYANKWIAIQPLLPTGYEAAGKAAGELGEPDSAVKSLLTLAKLEPIDPAGLDFQIAQTQFQLGQFQEAKQRLLQALEIAPRYRDAHRLLIEIADQTEEIVP